MMKKPLYAAMICFMLVSPLLGQEYVKRVGEIKYISQQSYYVNLGSQSGLSIGDTVAVKRNNRLVGHLIVENVARLSCSCKLLNQSTTIKRGDRVQAVVKIQNGNRIFEETNAQKKRSAFLNSKSSQRNPLVSNRKPEKQVNRIRGRLSVQSVFFDDQTNADLDYRQIGVRSKIAVEEFLGLPLALRFRWRTRAHHRDRVLSSAIDENEVSHNLYELGLVYQSSNSPFEFGLGRILSQYIRGVGYIDGGLFSYKMNGHFRVGVAGGTQPGLRNSAFQTNEQKFGMFVNFETGDYRRQKISSTAAFSGSYHSGTNSREFFYLQNNYSVSSKLAIYQSVEVDINRGWKNGNGKSNVQFSNFFLSTRYSPFDFLSLNFSYDARKAIRVFETRFVPDSLFDETTRQGLHSGITLRLPSRIRLSGYFGLRFRQGSMNNVFSASGSLIVPQIFQTWATFTARFSYFSSMFTQGYRPNFNIRFPIMRGLVVDVGGGSYINQIASSTSRSNWLETSGYYRINRWLFANFGYRVFLDDRIKSGRLFLESGIVF